MGIKCIVVSGKWKYENDGHWDFVIDQRRMCRVVHFRVGVGFSELCELVLEAFGEAGNGCRVSMSYLSPELESLAIGKQTPPVILSTDASLVTCSRHLESKKLSNLYVTFVSSEEEEVFTTPSLGQKRKIINNVGGCSYDGVVTPTTSAGHGKAPMEVCIVSKEWLAEVEAVEGKMQRSLKKPIVSPGFNLGIDEDDDNDSDGESNDPEDCDVRPRGYDKDFWEPLLDDTFGGSNAVEIMYEGDEVLARRNLSNEYSGMAVVATNSVGDGNGGLFSQLSSGGSHRGDAEVEVDKIDLPPMFDDTQYQTSFIPDLDLDEGDETIAVGKTFISKSECQTALAIYAIRNMFHFKQRRTTKTHFIVSCSDLNCGWLVNAHKLKDNAYYRIRKAVLDHTCTIETRSKFTKMATSKVIAHVFKSKFGGLDSGPKPRNLQKMVLEELRVSTSYSKCWRANQTASEGVRGTEEDSYLKVEEYLHMLKLGNPGSVTDILTETDDEGVERFLYLFFAFGASIDGFKMLRPVLVLDGTHLTIKYKGVLLTASGQDANFQVFPLAFTIVDAENDASWEWFLRKVEVIIGEIPSLAVISDRHQSILKACKTVFKDAHHGACIVHLSRNVISRFKNKGLANLVMKAGCANHVKPFKIVFEEIRSRSEACAKYLKEIGFEHWTRACFPGKRYNLMTSNIAESLNNALREVKRGTIIEVIMFIQSMLMRWFNARREKSLSHSGFTTPEVDRIITSNLKLSRGSKVTRVSAWSSEIVGPFGKRDYVQLSEKKCSCRSYDVLKIPCGHALIAAGEKGLAYGPLTDECYQTSVWAKTYAGMVVPNADPGDIDIPTEISSRAIQPPRVRRPCGRPRVNRIPSTGEIPEVKNQRKCGRCGGMGHNKTSCKNPI